MAITRRQFVSRLGALAAAAGMSQLEISKIAEAFASNSASGVFGPGAAKPKVVWIHGAECTGCSTSLLGILENPSGTIYGTGLTTLAAAGKAGITPTATPFADANPLTALPPFTLWDETQNVIEGAPLMNIADVVIDVIDLQYHETVMGMGGDLAAQWLKDFSDYVVPTPEQMAEVGYTKKPGDYPFVLVVEGALQDRLKGGAWGDESNTNVPWCSIGHSDSTDTGKFDLDMAETVVKLAKKSTCAAIIPIGQCASFGGYPGAKPRITTTAAKKGAGGFDPAMSQTGAMGVYDYLRRNMADTDAVTASGKVINVPGCPTNPWWFVLTVVMIMADLVSKTNLVLPPVVGTTLDYSRRAKKAYPIPVHSSFCPRHKYYNRGIFATKPGEVGCLQKLGCKGLGTSSLCGVHGWNNQQPQNGASSITTVDPVRGGHCTAAGHPCMGCTEKGYPDSFVPFVKL